MYTDEYFMKAAFLEAKEAFSQDEVPIGAVIVFDNKIIARAHNFTEKLKDATAHAEMIAITSASEYVGAKYLKNCTLYVTLEPCLMCVGAIAWSQIQKVVYAAKDEENGFLSQNTMAKQSFEFVQTKFYSEESSELIKRFFQNKRRK